MPSVPSDSRAWTCESRLESPARALEVDAPDDAPRRYSNILYVKECRAELSTLARTAVRHAKYRPETCCIIGNYYSLKAQHEKAVLYFRRALKLDHSYLSAWTRMGHECVHWARRGN